MNILFVTSGNLSPYKGGIDRVIALLKEAFEQNTSSHHHIIVLAKDQPFQSEPILPDVFIIPNNQNVMSEENITFVQNLILGHKIDFVVNHSHHLMMLQLIAISVKGQLPVITQIHTSPDNIWQDLIDQIAHHRMLPNVFQRIRNVLSDLLRLPYRYHNRKAWRSTLYHEISRLSDGVVLLSSLFSPSFRRIGKVPFCFPIESIPNPCIPLIQNLVATKQKRIVWLGRMHFLQKRPDRMLKIWEKVQAKCPDWELDMCGDGPALPLLKAYARKHHIQRCNFHGQVHPKEYLETASILCMTSSSEGFGMVLLEALQNGVVPIAMDGPVVFREIITDGKNGRIVPGVSGMVSTLIHLMQNKDDLARLSSNTQKSCEKFYIDSIAKGWNELFTNYVFGKFKSPNFTYLIPSSDMTIPNVSVCVPIFNASKFIIPCLESLFNQTLNNIEYIFVDDSSSDDSVFLLKQYISKAKINDCSVKLITHSSNQGVSISRQEAMGIARGKYIIHCDADDIIEPDMYKIMYEAAELNNADLVYCSFDKVGDNGYCVPYPQPQTTSISSFIEQVLNGNIHASLCNKLIRTQCIRDTRLSCPSDIIMCEDQRILLQLMSKVERLVFINRTFYHYRINSNSLTSSRYVDKKSLIARIKNVFYYERLFPSGEFDKAISSLKQHLILETVVSDSLSSVELKTLWKSETRKILLSSKYNCVLKLYLLLSYVSPSLVRFIHGLMKASN